MAHSSRSKSFDHSAVILITGDSREIIHANKDQTPERNSFIRQKTHAGPFRHWGGGGGWLGDLR